MLMQQGGPQLALGTTRDDLAALMAKSARAEDTEQGETSAPE